MKLDGNFQTNENGCEDKAYEQVYASVGVDDGSGWVCLLLVLTIIDVRSSSSSSSSRSSSEDVCSCVFAALPHAPRVLKM